MCNLNVIFDTQNLSLPMQKSYTCCYFYFVFTIVFLPIYKPQKWEYCKTYVMCDKLNKMIEIWRGILKKLQIKKIEIKWPQYFYFKNDNYNFIRTIINVNLWSQWCKFRVTINLSDVINESSKMHVNRSIFISIKEYFRVKSGCLHLNIS